MSETSKTGFVMSRPIIILGPCFNRSVFLLDVFRDSKLFHVEVRIFLLVDLLREIFFRLRVGGMKKKALKMTSQLVISELFF